MQDLLRATSIQLIPGEKKVQNVPLEKKSTKRAVLVLAVLFGVGGWSGSKFGFLWPKFYGEPKSGFGSVGSARVSALAHISVFGR